MKKLILMTSALALMGGTAFAQDISVSAEASVSYGNWETAPGTDASFSFGTELTFGLEATAGDYTYGAELTLEVGEDLAQGVIWVSGGFGKVSFGEDEFDELNADLFPDGPPNTKDIYDDVSGDLGDEDYGDVKYEGTFGDFGITLVADAKAGVTPGDGTIAAGEPTWWAEATYSPDGFSLGLETDSSSDYEFSASVDVGTFTIGGSVDESSEWDVFASTSMSGINIKVTADDGAVYGVELDGEAGDISWAVATNTDSETSASVEYSSGDLSIGLAYDNDDAGDAVGPVDPLGLVAGGLGVEDRGDEADIILTLGWAVDNLSFEVLVNGEGESEVSMTAKFDF